MHWPRAARPIAAASLLAAGAALSMPPGATAWSSGACTTTDGVTVVVDFGALGPGVIVRCVSEVPASGTDALADAGFTVTPVTTLPGFVCRIDGLPGPDAESCATTPPATAYWSYWTAPRGGSWRYSPVGATFSTPVAGTVEGWRFSTGADLQGPSVPPPSPPATPTPVVATPRPTATPRPSPTPRATPDPTALAASATQEAAVPSGAPSRGPSLAPSHPGEPPDATGAEASTTARPAGIVAEAGPAPPGPMGTIVGAGLVALVAGLAIAARRRGMQHD